MYAYIFKALPDRSAFKSHEMIAVSRSKLAHIGDIVVNTPESLNVKPNM